MSATESRTATGERPDLDVEPRRVRGTGGVRIVVRRELATKFFTKAFAFSTLLFALMSLAGPLLAGGDEDAPVLAHTADTSAVAASVGAAADDSIALDPVADAGAGRALVADGEADAVLVADGEGEGGGSYQVLVEDSLDPQLGALLQAVLQDQALREAATAGGIDPEALASASEQAAASSAVTVVPVGESLAIGDVMIGLGFAAGAVVVVLLWGIPLATDVMQEKVSRVVEILLSSLRPWQLLAGKVAATTLIGLTQLVVVLGAALAALALDGGIPQLGGVSWSVVVVGAVCLVLGIVTCTTMMAGLAARVERQEDLSSALQPALALALVPMAAAFYLVFEFADSPWLDIASVAPVFNTFVLPARLAVESVPLWQVGLSLLVAVATCVTAFAVAGRVYAGSVLRSGGRISLREALSRS